MKPIPDRPSYFMAILIMISQMVNVLFFAGWPDEMLSARAYRRGTLDADGKWAVIERMINTLFFWQYQHCHAAYEWEARMQDVSNEYAKVCRHVNAAGSLICGGKSGGCCCEDTCEGEDVS